MEQVLTAPGFRVRAGRWWFQKRGVSPLPWLALCFFLPAEFSPTPLQLVLVLLGILAAEGVRIWAVGYAGSATRTRKDKVPGLVHAGPFRFVRNPLYLANTALYVLCGVAFGFLGLAAAMGIYFAVQYAFIVAYEEDCMRRQFGVAYDYYCARVPRWVPDFKARVEASSHRFHLRSALRSERSTLLALMAFLLLWVVKHAL